MRYIIVSKQDGGNYRQLNLKPKGTTHEYPCSLYVEPDDYDALSVGQEITVDVVPVPKEA